MYEALLAFRITTYTKGKKAGAQKQKTWKVITKAGTTTKKPSFDSWQLTNFLHVLLKASVHFSVLNSKNSSDIASVYFSCFNLHLWFSVTRNTKGQSILISTKGKKKYPNLLI